MEKSITEQLSAFNQMYKAMDEAYHTYAKRIGISDMMLWLLYSLYESDTVYTQREICADWHCTPQTLNSALKNLEQQGFIELSPVAGNRKNKRVVLTGKGEEMAQRVIGPVVRAEQGAFLGLTEEERENLLRLTEKYTELLQNGLN